MSISVLKADLEKDENFILDFWKNNFSSWPEEKYRWFYKKNPYGRAECWVAKRLDSNMVVGSTAVFPRRFLLKGKYVMGGITGDFGMDKNHRILGPALKLQKSTILSKEESHIDFLYGYPNDLSEPVQRRAGFKIIGNTYRMVRVLRYHNYINRYIDSEVIAKLFSKPIDFIMSFFSKESRYRRYKDFNIELLEAFDRRFDQLWDRASDYYSFIGERTSKFLNWRFTRCPYRDHRIFVMSKKDKAEITGYIVYHISKNNVNIADLFVMDIEKNMDGLISQFISFVRKKGIETISIIYLGNSNLVNKLREYNFSIRDSHRKIVAYVDPDSPFAKDLYDRENWYLMEGDND